MSEKGWIEILKTYPRLVCGDFHVQEREDVSHNQPAIQHTTLRQLTMTGRSFRHTSFPALKALRLSDSTPFDRGVDILAEMPNRMPSLTELHFDAHIFTPALFYLDHSEKREFASHTVLPDLERLAFERATPAPYTTGDVILNLVQAGWTKLAPSNEKRGHAEISFQPDIVPESSCVSLQDSEIIKAGEVVQILNHISACGISIGLRTSFAISARWGDMKLPGRCLQVRHILTEVGRDYGF